ncbi:formate/nitrite transporter family protein [Collinsella tanakaei]|uniref:formate/nitrite transporter family protein n=1 Tax=Collinsella tanakaei TaxID=626935 RepID=UPI001D98020E|nr:formate/nitrite transporter family protein [Collinsella tanakaei]MBM6779080.1 formate/nitrite transporter family protein [Collinsella tanakaei]
MAVQESKEFPTTECLAPAQIEAKVEAAAITKAALPAGKMFVLAMLAGAFIAFGGLYFTVFLSDTALSWGPQRVVGGLVFCIGLVLVLVCGAELFTGNSLMVCALASGKIDVRGLLRNWVIVWLGNFAGALIVTAIVFFARIYQMNGEAVAATMVSIAAGKVTPDAVTLFFRGILCNVFVCLAVWIGFAGKTVTDKVVGILLPISGFVACGFEHCVANMYFLPMGAAMVANGYGADIAGAASLNVAGIFYNLAFVTLGNIVGGAVLVALAYWFVYHRKG